MGVIWSLEEQVGEGVRATESTLIGIKHQEVKNPRADVTERHFVFVI